MNFFDAQDHARRMTRWLVVVYVVATLLIIAGVTAVVAVAMFGVGGNGTGPDPGLLGAVALLTLLVILGATLYRTARLASGGSRVAEELGGVPITASESDPLRRRLRNVVEEMSIASGTPVPAIYVLEHEQGINAFAAGFTPEDAAIAVTRGCLEFLDRDELQGVVAHEFSHILNGDMRLNLRMMGVLFGIMVIGLIGRTLLRGGSRSGIRMSRRGKNAGGIVAVGLGLTILGWIGVFFARVIKAAVSRQREYLADASAVQFTRQTDGIANALKKIGGYAGHSYLAAADAEEISHMLFALGARFSSLFATHPPLTRRIQALDPQFAGDYPAVAPMRAPAVGDEPRAAGFADATGRVTVDPGDVTATVGQPGPAHVAYASALHASIPAELLDAAHDDDRAWLLTLSLLIQANDADALRQHDLLRQKLGKAKAAEIRRFRERLNALGPRYDFALLEIAFPALRRLPEKRREFLYDLGQTLFAADGKLNLREFCLSEVLARSLEMVSKPSRRDGSGSRADMRRSAVALVRILADRGHVNEDDKARAFRAGLAQFGTWGASETFSSSPEQDVVILGEALRELRRLNQTAMRTLVAAASATILADREVTVTESEILRTVCASLGCPMPPVLTAA